MLNKLALKYFKLILNPNPSKTWKALRFILHWVTLPMKIFTVVSAGLIQITIKKIASARTSPDVTTLEEKRALFQKSMAELKVLKTEELELYCDVIYGDVPMPHNYDTHYQALNQGLYAYSMNKLGLFNEKIDSAVRMHMQSKWLCRGYKMNPHEDQIQYDAHSTSGEMLTGMSLAMLTNVDLITRDKFEELMTNVVQNDYALSEYGGPYPGTALYPLYKDFFNAVGDRSELLKMKSSIGMFQPGLEIGGMRALQVLSALRVASKVCKDPVAQKAYNDLVFKYGYGLLALFPTVFSAANENLANCQIAVHILESLADTKLSKLFWKVSAMYLSALAYKTNVPGLRFIYQTVLSEKNAKDLLL